MPLLLMVPAVVHSDASPRLTCSGQSEPWQLVIDSTRARFERPMAGLGTARIDLLPRAGTAYAEEGARTWRGRAADADADLVVFILRTGRNVEATLSLPSGDTLVGSCTEAFDDTQPAKKPARSAQTSHLPWWERLSDLALPMGACARRGSGEDIRVSVAWWSPENVIHVRVRNAYGGWWHCTTEAGGHSVLSFDPLPTDAQPHPDEGIVIFTPRSNLQPPAGACYQLHRPVNDENGKLLGWLSDLVC
ncbi:MAG: hypothetical protein ACPGU7_01205 [Gammaproteobacteria bacterium]